MQVDDDHPSSIIDIVHFTLSSGFSSGNLVFVIEFPFAVIALLPAPVPVANINVPEDIDVVDSYPVYVDADTGVV